MQYLFPPQPLLGLTGSEHIWMGLSSFYQLSTILISGQYRIRHLALTGPAGITRVIANLKVRSELFADEQNRILIRLKSRS